MDSALTLTPQLRTYRSTLIFKQFVVTEHFSTSAPIIHTYLSHDVVTFVSFISYHMQPPIYKLGNESHACTLSLDLSGTISDSTVVLSM